MSLRIQEYEDVCDSSQHKDVDNITVNLYITFPRKRGMSLTAVERVLWESICYTTIFSHHSFYQRYIPLFHLWYSILSAFFDLLKALTSGSRKDQRAGQQSLRQSAAGPERRWESGGRERTMGMPGAGTQHNSARNARDSVWLMRIKETGAEARWRAHVLRRVMLRVSVCLSIYEWLMLNLWNHIALTWSTPRPAASATGARGS